MEPVTVERTVAISHDRYGIMLHDGVYAPVTASDWLQFRQEMESIIAIETAETERIRSNIAAIEEIHSLVRSMEESVTARTSRNDDDFASKSDDIESDMDFEYDDAHDDKVTSGFYDHKQDQLSGIKSYVQSFFNATCVEEEDDDGATISVIQNSDHFFAHGKGWDAINAISDRCEAEYEYKQALRDMPEGMRNRMPKE